MIYYNIFLKKTPEDCNPSQYARNAKRPRPTAVPGLNFLVLSFKSLDV